MTTLPTPLALAVAAVRRRVRTRRALEAATLFAIVALAAAALVVSGVKTRVLSPELGATWLWVCAALPFAGALAGAVRRVTPLSAAQLLDRAHSFDSRVASALEFTNLPDAERSAFMDAAIADAAGRSAGLEPARAMPLEVPRDWPIGLALLTIVLVVSQLEVLGRAPAPPISELNPLLVHPDDLDAFESVLRPMLENPETDEATREAAREFNDILERLADRELDRTEALRELGELETRLAESRPMEAQALEDALREMGNQLPRDGLTEAASEAMRSAEAEVAAAAMEQLAERMRTEDIPRAELDRLREAMERAAQDNSQRDREELERRLEEHREEMESLLQRQREEGGLDEEEESLLRRRQRELETLQRDQAAMEERRRQLDRLRREMEQTARDLNRNARDEAAQRMEQMAEDLNRMAREQMSEEQRQEMQRQMEQLREMIRRAQQQQGEQGQQGQQSQGQGQGREGMIQRFRLGAAGEGGQQARIRMPGEGQQGEGQGQQGQGQGQQGQGGQPGGQGQGQGQGQGDMELTLDPSGQGGGNAVLELPGEGQGQGQQGQGGGSMGAGAGTESGGDMLGDDPTRLNANTRDSRVEGQQSDGPSRSEVILGAAQRGFVGRGYRDVHTDYSTHAEEVLERDEVPPGYRFYVRRYFQLIRPRDAADTRNAGNPQNSQETNP